MHRPDYPKLTFIVPGPLAGEQLCDVRLSDQPHPAATVIKVSGDIDACNADHLHDYLTGLIHLDHPVVLDLSGVEFLGVAGFRAILRFGAARRRDNQPWALVTSHAVNILLRLTANDRPLPVVRSVDEALQGLDGAAVQPMATSVAQVG